MNLPRYDHAETALPPLGRRKTLYLIFADTGLELKSAQMKSKYVILTSALLLGACVATAPKPDRTGTLDSENPDLACQLPSNCVSSGGNGGLEALPFAGTPTQAMGMLQATLTTFPEATIVRSEPLLMVVIFTTPAGFRDQVDFRIDPQAQRIDFRSRSLFGLFDWGKNRSRMQEFKRRFAQKSRL